MVSSVWIGSVSTSTTGYEGQIIPNTSTVQLPWQVAQGHVGVTVSAQAALSYFDYSYQPDPTSPEIQVSALIKSYTAALSHGFETVPVNAPTLNNVRNVVEIIFELQVTAKQTVGSPTGSFLIEATMVGTVFIQ
jgi:hypothetical protein